MIMHMWFIYGGYVKIQFKMIYVMIVIINDVNFNIGSTGI